MAQPKSLEVESDLALLPLVIADFTPGLMSEPDAIDLPVGACLDCENVLFKPGRMLSRLGFVIKNSTLAGTNPDGVAYFYDANLNRRIVVWTNGAMYDLNPTTFVATLVQAGAYTAGLRVASAVLARILYFSDGETISGAGPTAFGIRSYDPITTPGSAPGVIMTPGGGAIPTPAAKVLAVKAGQLVLGRIKYTTGTYAKDSVMWSNVLDPKKIIGTNIFRIGEGQGGEVNCIVNMSITDQGITPFDGLFCGLSEFGVYLLKGALTPSTLSNIQLNCAAGVLDGATAKYIPSPKSAMVVFLATDRKVYATNGVDTDELSKQIRTELRDYIIDRYTTVTTPQFTGARNQKDHHYVLDVGGGRHYCYDWDLQCWTRYARWVSGYWVEATDANANPTNYVVSHTDNIIVEQNVGGMDDGVAIAPYWTSGWLSAGDNDVNKIFKRAFLSYKTDTGTIMLTARTKHGQSRAATAVFTPPSVSSTASALWDSAIWDSAVWASTVVQNTTPYKQQKRLYIQQNDGQRGKLQGFDIQLTLSQSVAGWFEPLNLNVMFLAGGRKHVA